MFRVDRAVLLLFLAVLSGCQFALTSVEVKPVHSSVQKPSNVALYVAIKDGKEPLTDLDESNFTVYENDKLVEESQAQLTLLNRDIAAIHHVLLLLDLSGPLDQSQIQALEGAVSGFVQSVTKAESVSVFGFDGGTELRKLGEFQVGHSGAVRLAGLVPGSPSRNLNGAAILALKRLNALLMRIRRPVRVGTLVVFTRGPDTAARETSDTVYSALSTSAYNAFAVGVKAKENYYLDDVGPSGKVEAESANALGPAFLEAAALVNGASNSHYLIQYCSPARAGTAIVRLEVKYVNPAGEERTGDIELGFDASGFGPGCNPRSVPTFQTSARDPWDMEVAPAGDDAKPAPRPSSGASSSPPPSPTTAPPVSGEPTGEEDEEDAIVPPPDGAGYE
ncbi:MAG TPA: hypothetical protein VFU02_16115 [Polyangiaceae bacterium]|nr:hypothetical protein [Polyangiaceae bacterium]